MGKKDPAVMAKQRDLFMEGAVARQIDKDLAGSIFDLMEKFAGYGFNKSHSAAYALVSYQTAWLKAHYPEFLWRRSVRRNAEYGQDCDYVDECHAMGLK